MQATDAVNEDTPERRRAKNRARARLRSFGIDLDTMTPEQVRQAWETNRGAYVEAATAGRHMEPVHLEDDQFPSACIHSRFGMLADALETAHDTWPEGWSLKRVEWPKHGTS